MNKFHLVTAAILPALLATQPAFAADAPKTDVEKASYMLGVKTAENFKAQGIEISSGQYARGVTDTLNNQKLLMSQEELQKTFNKFQQEQIAKITERENIMVSDNLKKSNDFLAANKSKPGVVTTSSGLQYIELSPGKGKSPAKSDMVTVNYRGTLLNGTEFDSSYKRKETSTFQLENLIPGWQEALLMMKPGAKWKIFVPPQLAYGAKGAGQTIEPNSALIFEIELVDVKSKS